MKTFLILISLFFGTSCFSQKTAEYQNANKQDLEMAVTLSGFPSSDTSSITFFKKNSWFILVRMQNPLALTQLQACNTCQEVFTDTFLNVLFSLQPEKPSFDCRTVRSTIINGKSVGSIHDFYMITDLEEETITIQKGEKTSTVRYVAPRYALKYCKSNANRLAFIKVSDKLLKIK